MRIREYAKKWKRDQHNNFAAACSEQNSLEELFEASRQPADPVDMKEWSLNSTEEWRDAVKAAITERIICLLQEEGGEEKNE